LKTTHQRSHVIPSDDHLAELIQKRSENRSIQTMYDTLREGQTSEKRAPSLEKTKDSLTNEQKAGFGRCVERDGGNGAKKAGIALFQPKSDNGRFSRTTEVRIGDSILDETRDERSFKHPASPFRPPQEPARKISEVHAWGVAEWGARAGAWGKGPDGLKDRSEAKEK
jgi:hypothetical protein